MKKIFFAAVFAGALLGFTSCGNREMVTDPEMETVIDSIKETQSGQTTEETMAGTEETAEVSTQTEPTEGQSEQIKIIRLTVKKTIRIRLREVDYEEYH